MGTIDICTAILTKGLVTPKISISVCEWILIKNGYGTIQTVTFAIANTQMQTCSQNGLQNQWIAIFNVKISVWTGLEAWQTSKPIVEIANAITQYEWTLTWLRVSNMYPFCNVKIYLYSCRQYCCKTGKERRIV